MANAYLITSDSYALVWIADSMISALEKATLAFIEENLVIENPTLTEVTVVRAEYESLLTSCELIGELGGGQNEYQRLEGFSKNERMRHVFVWNPEHDDSCSDCGLPLAKHTVTSADLDKIFRIRRNS